jgi:glutamine synthetase
MDSISWAPVYRAYGHNNRTLMCRMPMNRHCLEVRIADSAANFYLVTALVLAAGLEGIRDRLDPGDPVSVDTYSVDDAELARDGIHRLPRTLGEALGEFERDPLAAEVFGEGFRKTFLETKGEEWQTYNTVVGEWERDRYLHMW